MDINIQLYNIYIKIHNKRMLTMDDLALLAEYNPECFAKTCRNLIYNVPEAEILVEDLRKKYPDRLGTGITRGSVPGTQSEPSAAEALEDLPAAQTQEDEEKRIAREQAENFLNNLSAAELSSDLATELDTDRVKDLVGNLYMEMLYPHNFKPYEIGFYDDEDGFGKFDMKT